MPAFRRALAGTRQRLRAHVRARQYPSVLVVVVPMGGVPVSIMDVIDVVAMRDGDMAATLAVFMIVVFVDVLVGAHGSPSGQPLRATMTRGQGPDAVPDRPGYEFFSIRLSQVAPQLR